MCRRARQVGAPGLSEPVELIAGLGNPGAAYRGTRHNAGADFVEALARGHGIELTREAKFLGRVGRAPINGRDVRLLVPTTYVNRSGQALAAMARYYRIEAPNILVAHDELDFEPGVARFKAGGGHGGHNGLRDISKALGERYLRLRLGIGHPGEAAAVVGYVLRPAPPAERQKIDQSIADSLAVLPLLVAGDWAGATRRLHAGA